MCYIGFFLPPRPVKKRLRRLRAQASLEVMLILSAMFAALVLFLPAISYSLNGFFHANDVLLAKKAAEEVSEYSSLLFFLADGTQKTFYYSPASSIEVFSRGTDLVFVADSKYFYAKTSSPSIVARKEFTAKFGVTLSKKSGVVVVAVSLA